MYALYVTHPQVVVDPNVPVPMWSLSPEGEERARRFARHPLVAGVRNIVSSTERKAIELATRKRGLPERSRPRSRSTIRLGPLPLPGMVRLARCSSAT
jgi:hypothetical protein